MARFAPVLFVFAALLVAAVILFDGGDEDDSDLDITDDDWGEESAPELRTTDAPQTSLRKRSTPDDDGSRPPPPPRGRVRYIHGRVVDAASGAPIAGASLFAEHRVGLGADCERLPHALERATGSPPTPFAPDLRPGRADIEGATTDAQGRFAWWVGDVRKLKGAPFDVFAGAPGYVLGVHCEAAVGAEITIALRKAVKLAVHVTDPVGRPIEAAVVAVRASEKASRFPPLGTAGLGRTDEEGNATIDGLRPGGGNTGPADGLCVLHVDHPAWMPYTSKPFDPGTTPRHRVKLEPALNVSFTIRSDDGSAVVNPTLAFATDGEPPHRGLQLLTVSPNGPEAEPRAEVVSEPVRVSCKHAHVRLEVKADGFTAWTQKEPLPADGGARMLIVVLTRDTGLGVLRLLYEDPDGNAVSYRELGRAPPEIMHLGGQAIGTVTIEQGEALVFKSLPAGRYRVTTRSPTYAPASVEVEVRAGGEATERTLTLAPAARLRVRFLSDTGGTVGFRLLRGREVVPAFPSSEDGTTADAPSTGGRLSAPGDEGALFTGLPAGRITIEVTSPEHVAVPTPADLKEGETTEVEIEVRQR